ncbi:MAG TPA: phosphatidylglycerol lysyltransferase domain-containing protein, partial [Mycobacteriales bacterium]|nr:phosphatidylglycerol lysyltransferase domain-containing protein [Mycobacteriales bacterium]
FRAVLGLLAASIVFHVVKGLDVEEALVAAGMLVLLLSFRAEFFALGDPRTRLRAAAVFGLLAGTSFVLGLALVALRRHAIIPPYSFGDMIREVLWGLIGVSGPLRYRFDRVNDVIAFTLGGFGLLTALTTVYLGLRPAEPTCRLDAAEEARVRELLCRHGERDSLGYFATRRDKSVLWSATGKACISYRVISGVMLASGDPIGDPEAWPGVIAEFCAQAARHAWLPAVMGCSELGGEIWTREAGLVALELGDEAIVEVAEFTLQGRAMRNVRQMVARVQRAGYTAQVRRVRDISAQERALLREQAAAWRSAETERGFSMALGRFGDSGDGACVAITAHKDGLLRAFLHFVPWGERGLSLDIMRRDRAADPGLNEFLIVEMLRVAPELGVTRVSLNFAAFRAALERGERLGAGPILRAWRGVLLFLSRWFQIESLYRFNAKFRPIWEPRFICYPGAADLPRMALAMLEAEAFLVWPQSIRRRLRRLVPAFRS